MTVLFFKILLPKGGLFGGGSAAPASSGGGLFGSAPASSGTHLFIELFFKMIRFDV